MSEYTELASQIIADVGGKENVEKLIHCVTRLRFYLKDESKANDQALKDNPGVVTVVKSKQLGQYMVVIGEHVVHVYDEVMRQLGLDPEGAGTATDAEPKIPVVNRVLNCITGTMMPTLNVMCAAGILKGLLAIFAFAGMDTKGGLYLMINAAGDALFFFMPIIIGVNAAKHLKLDPAFGFLLGAALVYPAINNVQLNILGYGMKVTYTATFLPALLGVAVAAPMYKFWEKRLPRAVNSFMTPFLTFIVAFPLTFMVVGPVANLMGAGLNAVFTNLVGFSPILAGILLGALWQVFVLFGVHGVLMLLAFMDVLQGNPSQMLALVSGASFAMAGMTLAVYLKSKDRKTKNIALPSFFSAVFGVTEPATYGIALPNIPMLVIVCLSGGIGGLIVALANLKVYTYAGMGIIGVLGLMNPAGPNFIGVGLSVIVPFLVSLVLGYLVFNDKKATVTDGKQKPAAKETQVTADAPLAIDGQQIAAPISGQVLPISAAKDGAFSTEALGKGVVIEPTDNHVYAPFAGVVKTVFPTKHAIGIVSDKGCELLIHIGIDTVQLDGQHFKTHVQQGDRVEVGQPLVDFDAEAIRTAGYDLQTIVVVTNTTSYMDVIPTDATEATRGATVITALS